MTKRDFLTKCYTYNLIECIIRFHYYSLSASLLNMRIGNRWNIWVVTCCANCNVHISTVHDNVIEWKHFPRYWPFVWGIHRSLVNSPDKGQWREALMFSLIYAWINGCVDNREAGDLRRHRAHYGVNVMKVCHVIDWGLALCFQSPCCDIFKYMNDILGALLRYENVITANNCITIDALVR